MLPLLLLAAVVNSVPTGHEILSQVAAMGARRHSVSYSGVRHYTIRNLRFNMDAAVVVRVISRPGHGKNFTVLEHSGSDKLVGIVEKIMAGEAEASRPGRAEAHAIAPANYDSRVRGSETVAGRDCYVLDLIPKRKDKFLIGGTVWVDKSSHGIVRVDGTSAASISIWVGSPHVVEELAPVAGIWLPTHARSTSKTLLLGESRLEIAYTDYQVKPQ